MHRRIELRILLIFSCLSLAGCNRGPAPIKVPKFDADRIGAEAIEMFDKDGDGRLAGGELDACPGIKVSLRRLDQDSDQAVSAEEIAARVQAWLDASIGGLPVSVQIKYQGRPLDQAEIVFEPEPFLAKLINPARGVTSISGRTELNSETLPYGAQAGFYRVQISKADGSVPEKYNAKTTLGAEVSNESPGILRGRFEFDLK